MSQLLHKSDSNLASVTIFRQYFCLLCFISIFSAGVSQSAVMWRLQNIFNKSSTRYDFFSQLLNDPQISSNTYGNCVKLNTYLMILNLSNQHCDNKHEVRKWFLIPVDHINRCIVIEHMLRYKRYILVLIIQYAWQMQSIYCASIYSNNWNCPYLHQ